LPIDQDVSDHPAGHTLKQGAARARVVETKPMRYVARQPIFDREEKVFGYELLFRDGLENAFSGDSDEASRATLDRSLLMGLDVLCDGRRAFVNCTREMLLKDLLTYSQTGADVGPAQPIDCEPVMRKVLLNLQASIEQSAAEVSWTSLPTVQAHEVRLVQLLQNIIGNAIKYRSEQAPKIRVAADARLKPSGCAPAPPCPRLAGGS